MIFAPAYFIALSARNFGPSAPSATYLDPAALVKEISSVTGKLTVLAYNEPYVRITIDDLAEFERITSTPGDKAAICCYRRFKDFLPKSHPDTFVGFDEKYHLKSSGDANGFGTGIASRGLYWDYEDRSKLWPSVYQHKVKVEPYLRNGVQISGGIIEPKESAFISTTCIQLLTLHWTKPLNISAAFWKQAILFNAQKATEKEFLTDVASALGAKLVEHNKSYSIEVVPKDFPKQLAGLMDQIKSDCSAYYQTVKTAFTPEGQQRIQGTLDLCGTEFLKIPDSWIMKYMSPFETHQMDPPIASVLLPYEGSDFFEDLTLMEAEGLSSVQNSGKMTTQVTPEAVAMQKTFVQDQLAITFTGIGEGPTVGMLRRMPPKNDLNCIGFGP